MIKLTTENTRKAVERCKELKPRVKFLKDRVISNESWDNTF